MNQHWIFSFTALAWALIAFGATFGWAVVEALGTEPERKRRALFRVQKIAGILVGAFFAMAFFSLILPHTPEEIVKVAVAALVGGSPMRLFGPLIGGLLGGAVIMALQSAIAEKETEIYGKANRIAVQIYRGNQLCVFVFTVFFAFCFVA